MPAATLPDAWPPSPGAARPAHQAGPTGQPAHPPQPQWQALPLQFTGSGSEYFRIWAVNTLLVILTLSLYLPYAKARRLRYFHGNTLVDGHALGFHGVGSKMLRGYLLVLAFSACYALAGQFSPLAAGLAALALVALWPALWQASLRFRLANTSWRGLRLRFNGSVAGAYVALLPALLSGAGILLASAMRGAQPPAAGAAQAPDWAGAAIGVCGLLAMAMSPWLLARIKRYQHGHYQFAGDTTTLSARTRDFFSLWWRGGLLALVPLLLMVALGVVAGLAGLAAQGAGRGTGGAAAGSLIVGLSLLFYLVVFVLVGPWFSARLQNLVWGATASPRLRIRSSLRVRDLAWLTLKNLLLTVLTLGLYRPFAVVATTRLRLAAIGLQALGPPDSWVAGLQAVEGDAAGDAAGDLLGVDLGL